MSIERFWLNIRTAARLVLPPSVAADSSHLDESSIARMLHGAATWLSPRAVDGFDPKDFDFLERAQQGALKSSVERFRAVASAVPGNKPASEEQIQQAGSAFTEILKILRPDKFKDAESFRIQTLLERELQGKLPSWVESVSWKKGCLEPFQPSILRSLGHLGLATTLTASLPGTIPALDRTPPCCASPGSGR